MRGKNLLTLSTHTHTKNTQYYARFRQSFCLSKSQGIKYSSGQFLFDTDVDKTTYDQLRRASFSNMLNIAESTGRLTKPDKRHFYVIAIRSVFEVAAILDYLNDLHLISQEIFELFYQKLEGISKMLLD